MLDLLHFLPDRPTFSHRGTLASAMDILQKRFRDQVDGRQKPAAIGWHWPLLLVGVLMLAACAGGPTDVSPSPDPTSTDPPSATETAAPTQAITNTPGIPGTVTLWLDWDPAELRALERIIEQYRDIHPGARFNLVYFPSGELREALAAESEPDQVPSLVFGPSDWTDGLLDAGYLRDVSQVILPDQRSALHPFALEQVERGTVVAGLPLELQGTVLYRNRDRVEEPANTVDRIVEQSQQDLFEGGEGSSFDLGFRRAAPLVQTCRGEIVSDPEVVPLSQPAGLCWLRLLDRLGRSGVVTFDTEQDFELFQQGETLWLIDSTEKIVPLAESLGEDGLAIDPWPLYEATGESMLGAVWTENAYFPAAATDQDFEAAWSFATYLLAPENQRALTQARGVTHLPVLPIIELEDPLLRQAQRSLDTGVPLVDVEVEEQIRRELSTAIRLVVADAGDPELALGLALEEIRRARIPTPTPTSTPTPTLSPTPTQTPMPTPPPG